MKKEELAGGVIEPHPCQSRFEGSSRASGDHFVAERRAGGEKFDVKRRIA